MIDKKTENSIKSLIKILKKEKLSSIKFSNKSSSIELSQEITSQITRSSKNIIDEEVNTKDNANFNQDIVLDTIDSPMVGVVYLSAKPSSPTFIKKGQKIKKGSTICLIEAMKTFNEIKADKDGVVSRILVKNAEAVEFGQPLIELK
jgi:acetyl-CoA carboxylase biotin carboxyl carrier protein